MGENNYDDVGQGGLEYGYDDFVAPGYISQFGFNLSVRHIGFSLGKLLLLADTLAYVRPPPVRPDDVKSSSTAAVRKLRHDEARGAGQTGLRRCRTHSWHCLC